MPGRQRRLPDYILIRTDLDRHTSVGGNAGAFRSAELRPVAAAREWQVDEDREDREKPVDCHLVELYQ